MKKKKTVLFLLLIFSIQLLFSGCLDKKEVDQLSIIGGLAIDTAEGLGTIQVSAIITNFSKAQSDSSSSSPGISEEVVTATGKTLLDALDRLENISSKRIILSHNHVLIFGKGFAQKGISDIIDTLERNPFFRNTIYVAVANGKAYDVLKANVKSSNKQVSSLPELLKMFEGKSSIYPTRFYIFLLNIKSYTEAGTLPIIKISENNKLLIEDTALFYREKMVETLNSNQTLYLQWLLYNIKDRLILIPFNEDEKKPNSISLYFFKGKSVIKNKKTEEGFNVTIKCTGTAELRGSNDYFMANNPFLLQQVKNAAESYLKNNTEQLINFAQHSINIDFIGFGNNIYNNYPKSLENMQWKEEFPKVTYTVEFDVYIKSVGIIKNTIER
jgi:germination protein, Ger(x)C family